MTYTPDMLIKKEEFEKAFRDRFKRNLRFCSEDDIKKIVGNKLMETREFKNLDGLYIKKQELFSIERLKIDKLIELTEEEKQKIASDRLKNNEKYQDIQYAILTLEKDLQEDIEDSDEYGVWKRLHNLEDVYTIEGKEYYWIGFELSSDAQAVRDWCNENDVTIILRY